MEMNAARHEFTGYWPVLFCNDIVCCIAFTSAVAMEMLAREPVSLSLQLGYAKIPLDSHRRVEIRDASTIKTTTSADQISPLL